MSRGRLERSTGWHHRTTAISSGNRQSLLWRPVWSRLKASFPNYSAAGMAMCGSTGSPASSIPRIRRVSQLIASCFLMAGGIQTLRARRQDHGIVWSCCFLETALCYPLHFATSHPFSNALSASAVHERRKASGSNHLGRLGRVVVQPEWQGRRCDLYRGQGLRRIELRHLHPLCAASGFALAASPASRQKECAACCGIAGKASPERCGYPRVHGDDKSKDGSTDGGRSVDSPEPRRQCI